MASIQPRAGKWQLRVVHKLLPKPYFSTFASEAEAQDYGRQLETLLDRGIVPVELLDGEKRGENPLLSKLISAYLLDANVAPSDRPTLARVSADEGNTRLLSINASWADLWVSRLKVDGQLAPSTIRKRIESLARVIDAYWRAQHKVVANPLRMMPRGYANASEREAVQLKSAGLDVKRDVSRERRLSDPEYAACRSALSGQQRPDRERVLPDDPAFSLLFELICNTGLRLSEAYRLRVDQVDTQRWVLNVEGSKGHRGLIKPRVVPLVLGLRQPLADWCRGRIGRLFDFWDGTPEDRPRASGRLSSRFATLFDYAGVGDFKEHDLRHEATCRWVVLRRPDGHWVFSETEICKIMGWKDMRMMLRYASLRGEDLSARLG
jgi:integrase